MSDRQKLVYDLAMQAAALEVQSNPSADKSVSAALLDAFSASIDAYSAMVPDKLDAVLNQLKTV